jgi:hypothetical protein
VDPRKCFYCLTLAVFTWLPTARANAITPGNGGSPDVFTGQPAGILLVSEITPFSISGAQGTLDSAAYEDFGGTVDFYYQVNVTTATGPILFNNDFGFTGYTTDIGYRTDGASIPGGGFVDGTSIPDSVFRATDRVAFDFTISPIAAGESSTVVEIKTDATSFTSASALVSNESQESSDLATFGPFGPIASTPEPASILQVGGGLMGIVLFRRRNKIRK